jgi:iron(III) transport system substrate-binding protein
MVELPYAREAVTLRNKQSKDSNWPKDYFGHSEVAQFWWWLPPVLVALAIGLLLPTMYRTFGAGETTVIVYAAQDQVYAEPILKAFEKETGIHVRAVYDSEAVKTVGLANRLLAERRRPQCDVFWGNEELRTRQLAAANMFHETNGWAAFGYRSRRLVMASNRSLPAPRSLLDLTNEAYRGHVALPYPLFGSTATHLLALRQHWGDSNWLSWCRTLAANQPFLVDGNSMVVKFVARGEAALGLTDSDDVAAGIREGASLQALPITQETLLLPNTVAVVRRCPHPEPARRLFEFLQSREVIQQLVAAKALEGASLAEVKTPTLQPDWDALLSDLDPATEAMKRVFRR